MAKKPFRQLSAATQKRIRAYAAREGLTVRQVRARPEFSQAARGHGAATPSRAGGLGESQSRIIAERTRATIMGRLTSAEVQKVRQWFRRRAVQLDRPASDGEAAYKSVIGALREHPFAVWETVRDHIDFYPGGTMGLVFAHVPSGTPADDVEATVNRGLADEFSTAYGVDFDQDSEFLAFWPGSPPLTSTRRVLAAA